MDWIRGRPVSYTHLNHPFKVLDDEKMQELVESVKINGVLAFMWEYMKVPEKMCIRDSLLINCEAFIKL